MEIYLVRHGLTEYNEQLRYIGRTDLPLTQQGRAQADLLGERLCDKKFDKLFCSPKKRALETAEAIKNSRTPEIEVIQELDEIDFGDLEGLKFEEIQTQFPQFHRDWVIDPSRAEIPGGEPWDEFISRVSRGLDQIISSAADAERILVVAHGGTFRGVLIALGIAEPDKFLKLAFMHTSISIVHYSGSFSSLYSLNDTCHLESMSS